ncbi:MAG: (d)CMP kinase [Desulfobacteraceae bacterium]|nr:MAG: (d)CMP kinase [Desulfobacteraceae bacterium]
MAEGEIITIDGPAGSGKSTVGRALAQRLGFLYLDTGAMYRAVALSALRLSIGRDEGERLGLLCRDLPLSFDADKIPPAVILGKEDISKAIRSPEMDLLSSEISASPQVREAMTALQRRIASEKNVVAEGRDMGTVVFPRARHKLFLTAPPAVRAERRYAERISRGERPERETVIKELLQRDHQDETREIAPLRPAPDAFIIDTGSMAIPEVLHAIIIRLLSNGLHISAHGDKIKC